MQIDDYFGYGEASPLPFFSIESSKIILWKFEELRISLIPGEHYDKEELLDLFHLFTKDSPSLNFGLDIALYDILSKKEGSPLSKYLNNNALEVVNFSSIYLGDSTSINSNVVKIKLGFKNVNSDIRFFKKVVKKLSKNTLFRIDLNQSYDVDDAINLMSQLNKYNIEIQF